MVARTAKQAVIAGPQLNWRLWYTRLRGLLLVMAVCGLGSVGWLKLNDPGFLPIQKVRVQGAFIRLTEKMLLTRAGAIKGGYFNIDVNAVQRNIESLAWVDKAYVKRVWPDTLMITVIEQQALAWWQGKGLLNVRGELFYPAKKTFPVGLPQLSGPAGTHQQLLEHYQTMSSMLTGTDLKIQQLAMDARRAVTLRFHNGLKILLGRDLYYPRLERFLRSYNKVVAPDIDNIQQIDMRYTNGFAMLRKQ